MRTLNLLYVILAILAAGLPACSRSQSESQETGTTPKSTPSRTEATQGDPTPAGAQVKPGSYEDWCEEHGVQETMCTRCNPELIAAFKATADWCEEHGIPESQCRQCNPDLKIERPAKKEM